MSVEHIAPHERQRLILHAMDIFDVWGIDSSFDEAIRSYDGQDESGVRLAFECYMHSRRHASDDGGLAAVARGIMFICKL